MRIQRLEEFRFNLAQCIKRYCLLIQNVNPHWEFNTNVIVEQLDELLLSYILFLYQSDALPNKVGDYAFKCEKIIQQSSNVEGFNSASPNFSFPHRFTPSTNIQHKIPSSSFNLVNEILNSSKNEIRFLIGISHNTTAHQTIVYAYVFSFSNLGNEWFNYHSISFVQLNKALTLMGQLNSIQTWTKLNQEFSLQQIKRAVEFYYNCSLKELLQHQKRRKAWEEIIFSEKSLKEIAYLSGFANYKYLHRAFQSIEIPIKTIHRLKVA